MKVCGVELKGNEAMVCLLSFTDGLFDIPDCRVRRIALTDIDSREQLIQFQFTFSKLMSDYKIDQVVIRQRPSKGKFAGSAAGFKMEAAIQLIAELKVELITTTTVKEALKHNPLPIEFADTGLKGFQQDAFMTAFAFLSDNKSFRNDKSPSDTKKSTTKSNFWDR